MAAFWGTGLYWGFALSQKFNIRLSITLPFSFVSTELLRNYAFSGYPWSNLAYTQHLNLPFLQTASLWGVYGMTFILVMTNALAFELLLWQKDKRLEAFPRIPLLIWSALTAFSFAFGLNHLRSMETAEAEAPRVKAALIQGNIDQKTKNETAVHANNILRVYSELSRQIPSDVELVIWPEAAYPYSVPNEWPSMRSSFEEYLPNPLPWRILTGVVTHRRVNSERLFHNSAFLVEKDFSISGRFAKSHLVPFGEYVPLRDILKVEKIVPGAGMFVPGELGEGLHYDDRRFGALICYEGIFPEISREYANKDVQFLVNLTNDAWYGVSSAPYQHLSFYAFRAAENGKALLRAANTGFSAIIDGTGRVRERTPLFTRTALVGEIPLHSEKTLYTIIGDAPAWICFIAWLFGVGLFIFFHKNQAKSGQTDLHLSAHQKIIPRSRHRNHR